MIKAFVSVTCSDLVLMFPVWMLYFLVRDYLQGTMAGRGVFYIVGCVLCLLLIALTTLVQYRATFLATYVESGVRRIALAEQLRKIPLSFFGKKDLSDLTSTIMADCATMETASSHFIPELVGSCISTTLIAVGTFFMNWRMAIAALWVLPVSFLIVGCSGRVQKSLSKKQMKLKMDCADGIQECLETVRDLRANNAQAEYMEGLEGKIRAVEKHALMTELGTAVFVGGAQMILKLGIATVALTGGVLLVKGEIDILTFFVFLLLVSRMYDPLQVALQNLAAIISTSVQCDRLDEILSHEIQTGASTMDPKGYDIEFSHVGFSYDSQDTVLRDAFVFRTKRLAGVSQNFHTVVVSDFLNGVIVAGRTENINRNNDFRSQFAFFFDFVDGALQVFRIHIVGIGIRVYKNRCSPKQNRCFGRSDESKRGYEYRIAGFYIPSHQRQGQSISAGTAGRAIFAAAELCQFFIQFTGFRTLGIAAVVQNGFE